MADQIGTITQLTIVDPRPTMEEMKVLLSKGIGIKKIKRKLGNFGWAKPGIEAKLHPTIKDICWAAGIYEGEGCCYFKSGTQYVQIGNMDSWIIHKIQDLFGGGTITKRKIKNGIFYDWRICGSIARGFLMTIFSLLSPRRKKKIIEILNG